MIENLETIERPDDPDRCQGIREGGQCTFKAMPGANFCQIHKARGMSDERKQATRQYRLNQFQRRYTEFAEHDQVKSLRDEIGIARMTLESVLTQCQDESDLFMNSTKIADMVTRIDKLVSSCHRLEKSSGALLDKSALLRLGANLIDLIEAEITGYNNKISNLLELLEQDGVDKELVLDGVRAIKAYNLVEKIADSMIDLVRDVRVEDE